MTNDEIDASLTLVSDNTVQNSRNSNNGCCMKYRSRDTKPFLQQYILFFYNKLACLSVKSNTCDQTQRGDTFCARVGPANAGLGLGCLSETNTLAYYVPVNFVFNLSFGLGRRACFSKKTLLNHYM
jgi:hypothetical protein